MALAALVMAQSAAGQFVSQTTGAVTLAVYGNGVVGTNVGTGPGFEFQADQRMFHGQLIAAAGPDRLVGGSYYNPGGWTQIQAPASATPPAGFLSAVTARFDDSGAAAPIGLSVLQRTLARSLAQYIIIEYTVTNTGGGAIDSLYLGLFADFDVGDTFADDGSNFDADRGLLHTFDGAGFNPRRYGILSFLSNSRGISGWGDDPTVPAYTALTNPASTGPSSDIVNVIGTGPYFVPAGGDVLVRFAIVAGGGLTDIRQQATAAQGQFPTAGEGAPTASGLRLHSLAPNPASTLAIVRFTLPRTLDIEVVIVDVLGRRVASLGQRAVASGDQTLAVDVSSLLPGTYLLRLLAGGERVTQPLTVAR